MRKVALERAAENARRLGMDRRDFLGSAMGMCTILLTIDELTACSSKVVDASRNGATGTGDGGGAGGSHLDAAASDAGGRCIPKEAMFDESCANAIVGGSEFIFDVETRWFNSADLTNFPAYQQAFGPLFAAATEDAYVQQLFCGSDTTMACLSPWPGIECTDTRKIGCGLPLSNETIVASRDKINALAGNSQRVLNHVLVMPQDPSGIDVQLAVMERFHCEQGVAAWELYPGFKPGFLFGAPDGLGERILQKGLELGVNRFCIHKGPPIGNFYDATFNYPDDVGPMASKYPDANFVVFHAAYCAGLDSCSGALEGPYDESSPRPTGTDALIRTVLDAGIPPGGNVYAEIGKAFNDLFTSPDQVVHFLGKLLKYLGPDNVLWGTGAIQNGSPQALIEAFRSLQIPDSMQAQYGYPALTPEIKAKIFGLNAAKLYGVDPSARRCRVSSCPAT